MVPSTGVGEEERARATLANSTGFWLRESIIVPEIFEFWQMAAVPLAKKKAKKVNVLFIKQGLGF